MPSYKHSYLATMTTQQLLEKYLTFYKDRGHKQIPNVSLVPEGDSTLLFVNSGMFPLVPYLTGESHPLGHRLVNVQRSLRLEDIEEIGDATHTLAFHMIGNWSLNDYFKQEQLPWVYEFLIEVLGLDPHRMFPTVFAGDAFVPKDTESLELITKIFAKYGIDAKEGEKIFACGRNQNWWQRGDAVGELGGPDSEIHYYIGEGTPKKNLLDDEKSYLELGNSVFMQYKKSAIGWEPLVQKNVDFGGGMERMAMIEQGKSDIFETDTFWPIIEQVVELTGLNYKHSPEVTRSMRILADHMRAATLLVMDGVVPSNKDQGYILRRVLRRMIRAGRKLGMTENISVALVGVVVKTMAWLYPQLVDKQSGIEQVFALEEEKFRKTLEKGNREVEKLLQKIDVNNTSALATAAFEVYQSLGYPVEIFLEDLRDKGVSVDAKELEKLFNQVQDDHQQKSRSGAEQKFKGGLANHSEEVIKYHTTTHLLQQALREVLGEHVHQLGSNNTVERLRFDFPNSSKLTDAQLTEVTQRVNAKIAQHLPVQVKVMAQAEAKKAGALFIPTETYPDQVKVYFIGDTLEDAYSKELCGGPHVANTSELYPIEIYKQESIGEGKLRVYVRFRK